jgi:predicted alpha/beta superfamily hydrolase
LIAGRSNRKLINRQARPSNELARLALNSIFGEASRFSMPKHTLTGNIKRHRAFPSKILGNRRDVLVYLPRGYRRFSRRRYPVLYLQDGQNVFDAATSFSGVEWGVDEAAERLIKGNLIEPLIVVAVANAGEQRIDEYAPTRGVIDAKAKRKKRSKGLARKYGHFLMDELKPYIDQKYRTNPDAEFTGLGGSSLGGLVTFAIGILYPQVFGRLMVMSPSIWWDNFAIYRLVDSIEQKPPLKVWLDIGTAEPGWEQARELVNRLLEKGWKLQKDLLYMESQGADHSEAAWAARVEPALRFLFPPAR